MAECGNCGNLHATRWKVTYSKDGRSEECDKCGHSVFNTWIPDVSFKAPHYDPNITDNMGKPIFLESRQHKARIMRDQGIREANDRNHGGPGHIFGKR